MKKPEGLSKWEFVGVSAWPVVEAMIAMELPAKAGITEAQFFSILAALMSLMAMARAASDVRAKAKAKAEPEPAPESPQ